MPREAGNIEAQAALRTIGSLTFGSVIGVNRTHHVGLNSFDDLFAGEPITEDVLRLFSSLIEGPHNLELFHQLIFSAVKRLKRNEHALAVLDAQSAVESLVAVLVNENLQKRGQTPQQIEAEMAPRGRVHTLQRRFEEIERLAAMLTNPGAPRRRFLGSREEADWRQALYRLRNRIVHEGLRSVPFAEAKAALVAGLHAIHAIQDLTPSFTRSMIWSGTVLDLAHIQLSAGRLSRLFEA